MVIEQAMTGRDTPQARPRAVCIVYVSIALSRVGRVGLVKER